MSGRHAKQRKSARSSAGPSAGAWKIFGLGLALSVIGGALMNAGEVADAVAATSSGAPYTVAQIAEGAREVAYGDLPHPDGGLSKELAEYVTDMTRDEGNGTGCEFDYAGNEIAEAAPGVFDRLKRAARYTKPGKVSRQVRDARYALGWFVGFCYLVRTEGSGYGTQRAEERFSDLGSAARYFVAIEISALATKSEKEIAFAGAYFTDDYRGTIELKAPTAHAISELTRVEARALGCPWDYQGFPLADRATFDKMRAAKTATERRVRAWYEGYCFLDGKSYRGSEAERAYARLGSAARVADALM